MPIRSISCCLGYWNRKCLWHFHISKISMLIICIARCICLWSISYNLTKFKIILTWLIRMRISRCNMDTIWNTIAIFRISKCFLTLFLLYLLRGVNNIPFIFSIFSWQSHVRLLFYFFFKSIISAFRVVLCHLKRR